MNVITMLRVIITVGLALTMGSALGHSPPRADLLRPKTFLSEAFVGQQVPDSATVWMAGDVAQEAGRILGHKPRWLRLPYWRQGQRTAWVLENSMDGAPVTVGVIVEDRKIAQMKILVYGPRHGRGVTAPGFLNQFKGVSLNRSGLALNRSIRDAAGIGRPVELVTNLARLALYLDEVASPSERAAAALGSSP